MSKEKNWIEILLQCKNEVQKGIQPFLKELKQPQPDLGIGAGGDSLKKVDNAAEKAIIDTLKSRKIDFTLISEESGIVKCGEEPGQNFVTTDPIDGTTNLMREIPFYATSIAVSSQPTLSTIHTSLVADLCHGTTFTAQKNRGACRNGERISPSKSDSVENGLIGLDLNSYRIQTLAPKLTALMSETKHLRHFGANALELCYVADGTLDAFVDVRGKLRTTDMAAAWLIIQETGAFITMLNGKPLDVKLDPKQKVEFVASANKQLHERILRLLKIRKEKR